MATIAWHYTVTQRLDSILADGVLYREGERGIYHPNMPRPLCPAVWFSTREPLDPTAIKRRMGRTLTIDEQLAESVRIGVEISPALLTFEEYRMRAPVTFRLSENKRKAARELFAAMASSGRKLGANPDEWYVSLEPVPGDRWVAVQVWRDGSWGAAG